jgi:hypothetical protein
LGEISKGQRPLTESENEFAQGKRELSLVRMERDISRVLDVTTTDSMPGSGGRFRSATNINLK